MKIIILVQFPVKTGGMMQSLWSLVNGLSAYKNFEISLVLPRNADFCDVQFKGKVDTYYTSRTNWTISKNNILDTFKLSREIHKLVGHLLPEAIILSNDVGGSILLSLMPTIKRIQEVYVCRGGNFHGAGLGGWFMRKKLRFGNLDHVVVISSHLKANINKITDKVRDIQIIHNGMKLPTHDYCFVKLSSQSLKISSVGYISDGKNHKLGVDVVASLRNHGINAVLQIWGEAGCESDRLYLNELQQHISDLQMNDYVKFMGFVKGEKIFEETDLLISFSRSEGFGRTLVESMLRKKPTIAWRGAGGPVDITNNGEFCYLVDRNECDDYCNIIEFMMINPDMLSNNVERSYNHALMNFTEESMIEKYVSYFESF